MNEKAERLSRLAGRIDEMIETRWIDLVHQFETEEGMKLSTTSKGGGICTLQMAGITATSTVSERGAMRNWAAAARRKMLEMGA